MNTRISITMRIHAYHGVMPQERQVGNDFVVALTVDYPFESAMSSDALEDTLSYADVSAVVGREMSVPSQLLEHVAGRIIGSLKQEFPKITGGKIRITKVKPPIAGDVVAAVEVEW